MISEEKQTEKLWMRLLGHAVKVAAMFIELYENQKLRNCWTVVKNIAPF